MLDGTYGATVTFNPKKPPLIGLEFGGHEVIVPQEDPPDRSSATMRTA
jgi:hypothetical protein